MQRIRKYISVDDTDANDAEEGGDDTEDSSDSDETSSDDDDDDDSSQEGGESVPMSILAGTLVGIMTQKLGKQQATIIRYARQLHDINTAESSQAKERLALELAEMSEIGVELSGELDEKVKKILEDSRHVQKIDLFDSAKIMKNIKLIKKTHLAQEMIMSEVGRRLARKLGFKLEQVEDWLHVLHELRSVTAPEALQLSLKLAESTEFGLALLGTVEERAKKIREDSDAVQYLNLLDRSKIARNIKVFNESPRLICERETISIFYSTDCC